MCIASDAPRARAPKAMPSASAAMSTRSGYPTSRTTSGIRFRAPQSTPSTWSPSPPRRRRSGASARRVRVNRGAAGAPAAARAPAEPTGRAPAAAGAAAERDACRRMPRPRHLRGPLPTAAASPAMRPPQPRVPRGADAGGIEAAGTLAAAPRRSDEVGYSIDRRIAAGILRRAARIGQANRPQPGDAETARRIENAYAVVHEQGALRYERLLKVESRPKLGVFLGGLERMSRITRVEIGREPDLFVFDRQSDRMGVGDEHQPLAAQSELGQEILCSRQIADLFQSGALDGGDVQSQLTAPMVDAVPADRAHDGAKFGSQQGLRLRLADGVFSCVAARNQLLPEPIVESLIEQRSVHVQKDGINRRPVERSVFGHLRMITTDEKSSRHRRVSAADRGARRRRDHANLRRRNHGAAQTR